MMALLSRSRTRALARTLRILAALMVVAMTQVAHARPMEGRLGIGGQTESGLLGSTLSLRYWVSDLGLQALAGFAAKNSTATEVGFREYRIGVRLLYSITRTRLTNLVAGVGFATFIRDSKEESENPLFLDIIAAPEFFLGDNFAVSAHVSFSIEFASSPRRSIGSAAWGAGFHYYF
jgi:hypothetical protein